MTEKESYTERKEEFLSLLREQFGDHVKRKNLVSFCDENNLEWPHWFANDPRRKLGRGVYHLEELEFKPRGRKPTTSVEEPVNSNINHSIQQVIVHEQNTINLVPEEDPLYVRWGTYDDVIAVIRSKEFCNMFITGLSGNGKTMMVEQACSKADRELFRVNITEETDEDDLIGGFRLINGETHWFDGPVVRAMKAGGVLLLDEVDLASTKIMCLQPVLEGKGILLKKINTFIKPEKGFTVVATANTKGKGNENGQFIGTNVLNEAFLERFPLTFEQPYPKKETERNILSKVLKDGNLEEDFQEELIEHLLEWAHDTRKTYDDEGCDEIISTRRLVHIANAFLIFMKTTNKDGIEELQKIKNKAVELCVSRFDDTTKEMFLELFKSMDPLERKLREKEREERAKEESEKEKNKDEDLADIIFNS